MNSQNKSNIKDSMTELDKILEEAKREEYLTIKITLPPHLFKWVYLKCRNRRPKMGINEYIVHLIKVRKGYYDRHNIRKQM